MKIQTLRFPSDHRFVQETVWWNSMVCFDQFSKPNPVAIQFFVIWFNASIWTSWPQIHECLMLCFSIVDGQSNQIIKIKAICIENVRQPATKPYWGCKFIQRYQFVEEWLESFTTRANFAVLDTLSLFTTWLRSGRRLLLRTILKNISISIK